MFKKLLKFLLFTLLSFIVFIVLLVLIAAFTMGPKVKSDTLLVLDLQGPLLEVGPQNWKERLLIGDVLTTRSIIESLRKAKTDDRVRGLLVTAFYSEMGMGRAQEIRGAISDFARSKKPVYGYLEDGDTLEYYLCSAAPKLYMPPDGEGGVTLLGLRAEVPFFKGTLDKLGIVAQMDHVGKYKSASEIYTRESMSEADREATEAILDSLYERLTSDIARDRKLTVEKVKQIIDAGPPVRKKAKEAGLVDDVIYRDELEERIKKEWKIKELNRISVLKYQEPTFMEAIDQKPNKIAIVYATGTVVTGDSSRGFGEDTLGSGTITRALRSAREDESVKAVIVRVDSPGGSAVASDLIWREIEITKKKKPVLISMADVAASGGYYISMGATKILADPSTITGSIGVVFGKFYVKGLYDKIGYKKEVLKRGEHADLYSSYVPFDETDWTIIHEHMNAIYDSFTNKAATGRKKTKDEIHEIGQGRVWTGDQALKLGLIDQLGGLQDAIDEAKKMAKLEKEEVSFSIYPVREETLGGILFARSNDVFLPEDITRLLTWARISEKEHLLFLMPYQFRID